MSFSIIVPLYNAEQFIVKCLDSIFEQSYSDFECIVVDDGSTDNGLALCTEYAKEEERLRVFHIENSGVCKARNIGIKEAKYDWITFIDSDDFIDSDYLKSFVPHLSRNRFCTHRSLKKVFNGNVIQEIGVSKDSEYNISSNDNYVLLNKNHLILASSCFKMFSKELLFKHDIFFDEKITCVEDRIFVAQYLMAEEVNDIRFVDACAYNYVIHEGSSTTFSPPPYMYAEASMRWYGLMKELNKKFNLTESDVVFQQKRFIKNQLIDVVLGLYKRRNISSVKRIQIYKYIKNAIVKEFKGVKLERGYTQFASIIENTPYYLGSFLFFLLFKFKRN